MSPEAKMFVEAAHSESLRRAASRIEFNIPANIITLCDSIEDAPFEPSAFAYSRALRSIRQEAEGGMLQLALITEGTDPGSNFIATAVRNGWRYRIDKGFYRLTPEGEIERELSGTAD